MAEGQLRNIETLWSGWNGVLYFLEITPDTLRDEENTFNMEDVTTELMLKAQSLDVEQRPKKIKLSCSPQDPKTTDGLPHLIEFLNMCQVRELSWAVDPQLFNDEETLAFAIALGNVTSLHRFIAPWPKYAARLFENENVSVRELEFDIYPPTNIQEFWGEMAALPGATQEKGEMAALGVLPGTTGLERLGFRFFYPSLFTPNRFWSIFRGYSYHKNPDDIMSSVKSIKWDWGEQISFGWADSLTWMLQENLNLVELDVSASFSLLSRFFAVEVEAVPFRNLAATIKLHPTLKRVSLKFFMGDNAMWLESANDLLRHMIETSTTLEKMDLEVVKCSRSKQNNDKFELSFEVYPGISWCPLLKGMDSDAFMSKVVYLESNQMGREIMHLLANPMSRVETLVAYELDVEGWNAICNGGVDYKHLTKLDVSFDHSDSVQLDNLIKPSNLLDLTIFFDSHPRHWTNLGTVLGNQTMLQNLRVDIHRQDGNESYDVTGLGQAINNHGLQKLSLQKVPRPIVEEILGALETNENLELLELDECMDFPGSITHLALRLKQNRKLQTVRLSAMRNITESSHEMSVLAAAVGQNKSLLFLDIFDPNFLDVSWPCSVWSFSNEHHVRITKKLNHNKSSRVSLNLLPRILVKESHDPTALYLSVQASVEGILKRA